MDTLKSCAETLIYKGASIVPVHDKRPSINDWAKIRGEEILEDIYTVQWRQANGIGIICGEASGIICLDIDILRDNPKVKGVLEQIEERLPPVMCGLIGNPARIPARFFKYNGEKAQKFIYIDVEILSDGNQKVIPPSKHPSGKTYTWVGQSLENIEIDELPDIPEGLIEFLNAENLKEKERIRQEKLIKKVGPLGGKAKKVAATIVDSSAENTGEKVAGRCMSGSHNTLSALAVALFHDHCPTEQIIEQLIHKDLEINESSDYLYFECPSRKEWRGSKDVGVNAAKFVAEVAERNLPNRSDEKKELAVKYSDKLIRTKGKDGAEGHVINNLANVKEVIAMVPGIAKNLWYDDFHHKFMGRKANGKVTEWQDEDDLNLTIYMQQNLNMPSLKDDMTRKARVAHSMDNIRNEPRDWLSGLTWDGVDRVGDFFHKYMGCVAGEYTTAVSVNFWVSMVARIMMPGCKVDNMVILEGPQGAGKSRALKAIAGKWYVESSETLGSKDFYQVTQGNMIVEIGELDSFSKAEATTIKKVISTATDRFRPPYGRTAKDFPRQCIFVGTTNEDDYLKDATGGRRFWPIACEVIDYKGILRDREQLFAEAVGLYNGGKTWWEVPEMALILQKSRTEEDPWSEDINDYIENKRSMGHEHVMIQDILKNCLMFDADKMDKRHSGRVGKILRILGWGNRKSIKDGNQVKKGYFKVQK